MNSGTIMLTCLLAVAAGEAKNKTQGKGYTMEPVIAAFVLGIFLFVFDTLAPTMNKWMIILIIVTVLLTNGQYLLAILPTNKKG